MPEPSISSPALHDRLRRRLPRATVTQCLVGANLLVFLAMLASGAGFWHSANGVQLAWGANFGPATQDGQWWRLGSAMFLHFGVVHLAFNMWALWDGGQLVERMYGSARFAGLYFVSGLVGNLLSLVAHGGQAVSGGASGAIFGVYGALLVFLWHERRSLDRHEFRWLFWGALAFAAATIAFGFMVTGIDNAAHVGGFVTGLLSGVILLRPLAGSPRAPRRNRLMAAGGLALAVAALIANVPAPAYRWSDEQSAQREIRQFIRDDAQISRTWQKILDDGKRSGASFDELAGRIDTAVVDPYEESFEQLSQLPSNPALPSSITLESLRRYAEQRRDVSRSLVEGLRANDRPKIRAALEKAKRPGPLAPAAAEPEASKKP